MPTAPTRAAIALLAIVLTACPPPVQPGTGGGGGATGGGAPTGGGSATGGGAAGGGSTAGGGGATGGGGSGGGGSTGGGGGSTGGGGGTSSSGLSSCQAFDTPQPLSFNGGVQPVVAMTSSGEALYGWYDGDDESVNWVEQSASGRFGTPTRDLDAGLVTRLTLTSNGTRALGVFAHANPRSLPLTLVARRFTSGSGWEAPISVGGASDWSPQLMTALDADGTATLWTLGGRTGTGTQLDEVRSSAAGPLTMTRTLSDAGGVELHAAAAAGTTRVVAFTDATGPRFILSSSSGDQLTPVPGASGFVAAVASDSSTVIFGGNTPTTDGGVVVTIVSGSGPRQLSSVAPVGVLGTFRAMVGALASPGNAVVMWVESNSTLVADLYVSREVGTGGWSAPRLVGSPSFATSLNFFRLNETTGVVTFLSGTTLMFEWVEVRTDGFVGTPTPVPLSFSISGMAGSATRVAAVGTATLPDGGTGIYASQCR